MKKNPHELLKSYLLITLGSVIYSLAFCWFYAPNQVAMGGLTGLGQVINSVIPVIPVGFSVFAMNIPLFFLGWKYIGGHLLVSSLYAMAVTSFGIDIIDAIHPFSPMDPMLATVCGGVVMGIGLGIVFAEGATTGGTDIVARLLKLKFPWLPLGKLVIVPDLIVIALAAIAFGNMNSALYGLVALFIYSKVMDVVLYGMDTSKVAYIVSDQNQAIASAILAQLDRGATFLHGEGAFTGQEKKVLLVAFKQREIVQIKRIVNDMDPTAFLIVCDAHDVLGEGFHPYQKDEI